jgi:signal transduction histidine kinase
MSDISTITSTRPLSGPRIQIVLRPRDLIEGLKPEYCIERFPATVGRHPTNDIELPFEAISRYHARIELQDNQLRLVDLRSSNGSYVNQKRVQIAPLEDQDTISFGSMEFALTIENIMSSEAGAAGGDDSSTSIHFIKDAPTSQVVYHTDLPEDTFHSHVLDEEITNEHQLKVAKNRLITLYRLQDVVRATDEGHLLNGVLDLLFDVLPVDRGVILTRDPDEPSVFRPVAIKTKHGTEQNIGISKTILQRCLNEKVAILVRDTTKDSRFEAADSIHSQSMQSVVCVPLISVRHVFGFIHLDTLDAIRSFTEDDLAFLATVGGEVATRLHNLRMLLEKITSERMAAIGQTITGMAHNIKNILVLSQGGIEMMEKHLHKKQYDSLEETWLLVRRGINRINQLVQDMLDYSRARTVEKRKVDLVEFISNLKETFSAEMEKRGIQCQLDLEEDIGRMMLDPDGLNKALCNLIVNALEACPERGGQILMRARKAAQGNVIVEVEDNGSGIPAEVQPRIFAPFFTTKGSRGSGLGLAMTRKFIEDMGGRIDVRSEQDQGTVFTITLYQAAQAPRLEASDSTSASVINED